MLPELLDEPWIQRPIIVRIEEGLFLGNAAAAADTQYLVERISADDRDPKIAVLNASDESPPRLALSVQARGCTSFTYHQIPFTDVSHNPMDGKRIWEAVKWIHEMLGRGPVLVHCHAGVGRSASLIAAYLRLIRHPNNTYDEIIDMMNYVVNKEGHQIFPHLDLPETLRAIQEHKHCRRELASMIGKEIYVARDEPAGEVQRVSLMTDSGSSQTKTIRKGDAITVLAEVEFLGAEPSGVLLHTSLSGDVQEVPMRAKGIGVYQAEVLGTHVGDNFWIKVSATMRRHDHPKKRKWASTEMRIIVQER